MKICVFSLGYIGLPTAATMAARGFEVHGCNTRPDMVEKLASGQIHIEEPGLATIYQAAHASGRLQVGCEPATVLGKPILVTCQKTKRPEAVDVGVAKLIGDSADLIFTETNCLLTNPAYYQTMVRGISTYGDGKAAGGCRMGCCNRWGMPTRVTK